MGSVSGLCKSFIILVKRQGLHTGLRAVFHFFVSKYFEFKYRLLTDYFNMKHLETVPRRIHGSKMYLIVNDPGLSRELLLHRTRERLQTSLTKQLLKPGMVVVDIGANLGYYVLIQASIVGKTGKVYAIEPIPRNYELLCKNVRENKYENVVETYCFAISDTCGMSKIAMTKESNLPTMLLDKAEISEYMEKLLDASSEKVLDVEIVTLDKFLENKAPPDFVRLDIEGYEAKVIKGMSGTLRNSRKGMRLFMEIHPGAFREPRVMVGGLIEALLNSGFEVKYIVDRTGDKFLDFSADSLLTVICSGWAPAIFLEKR